MSRLDRWLLRAAALGVILLALYAYSTVLVEHAVWKIQITQAVNALGVAARPAALPRPVQPAPSPPEPK
jgi:hypothetical protein